MENYTDDPDKMTVWICGALERMEEIVNETKGTDPFGLIPELIDIGRCE